MLTPFAFYSNWVNRSSSDKLNILTHSTHERYQSIMAKTGHNFFFLPSAERHSWNTKNCPIPDNIKFLEKVQYGQPETFDIIISHTLGQLSEDVKIAKGFGLPIILMHHCLRSATGGQAKKYWEHIGKSCGADYTVFITQNQAMDWYPELWPKPAVIYHGVDNTVFQGWQPNTDKDKRYVLNVTNDFIGRGRVMGWDTFTETCKGIPVKCVGDTRLPDRTVFSEAAPTLEALAAEYRSATAYFNVTRLSSISTSFLEAMVTGVPCITVDTFSIREFFNHEEHCLIFNESQHDLMKMALEAMLAAPEKFREMGMRARQRCIQIFSVENHTGAWNDLLYRAVNERVNPTHA
jgi:glycosyltransferase involved in cell wall biosynthesis